MKKVKEDMGANFSGSFSALAPEHVNKIINPTMGEIEPFEYKFEEAKKDFSINIDEFCID